MGQWETSPFGGSTQGVNLKGANSTLGTLRELKAQGNHQGAPFGNSLSYVEGGKHQGWHRDAVPGRVARLGDDAVGFPRSFEPLLNNRVEKETEHWPPTQGGQNRNLGERIDTGV